GGGWSPCTATRRAGRPSWSWGSRCAGTSCTCARNRSTCRKDISPSGILIRLVVVGVVRVAGTAGGREREGLQPHEHSPRAKLTEDALRLGVERSAVERVRVDLHQRLGEVDDVAALVEAVAFAGSERERRQAFDVSVGGG